MGTGPRRRLPLTPSPLKASDSGRAIAELRQLVDDCARVLGVDNQETLAVRALLARVRFEAHEPPDEVGRELAEVLADQKRVLGLDHPDTLSTAEDLTLARADLNSDYSGAAAKYSDQLKTRIRTFEPDHPAALSARLSQLAVGLVLKRPPDVLTAELTELLADYTRTVGADHPDVSIVRRMIKLCQAMNDGSQTAVRDEYTALMAEIHARGGRP